MLQVETYLDKTERGDIGLYASNDISKGTIIWRYDHTFIKQYTNIDLHLMNEIERSFVKKYAYLCENLWILCLDNSRFINHSNDSNLHDDNTEHGNTSASRDIKAGEELTCNYYSFDAATESKLINQF